MNPIQAQLRDVLRAEAREAAMSTQTQHEFEVLTSRLEALDRRSRTQRIILAAVAAVAALLAGAALVSFLRAPQVAPVVPPEPDFTSTSFGVPFSVDLPAWTDQLSSTTSPTSEAPGWVTWNRCPDPETECIGLSFNRYSTVNRDGVRTPVTVSSYYDYLKSLAADDQIDITGEQPATVDGRPAIVLTITGKEDLPNGLGCHRDGSCDQFFPGVPGRYAIVDTQGLDPQGAVLVLWTRSGAVAAAESTWLDDFDKTLASFRFVTESPSPSA
jgi:hypothetical protein